ncbi:lipopolysaccharide biosynthesis protein [Amycolatopsis sp. SB7-3]|uniref:lipopolysaccharide biosynthesis protein n=1 Tax=Amycolatopsis sp. SB7-3 TaxID=3373438 RepID=UPI0037423372
MSSETVTGGTDGLAKDTGKSAGRIGVCMLIGIALGYVLTVVWGRTLPPGDNKVLLSFWGVLMGLGAAVSPLEQEISRQSAHAALNGRKVGRPALIVFVTSVVAITAVASFTLLPPVTDRVYGGRFSFAVIVLAGGLSFVFQFAARGLLIGYNQVRSYSWLLLAEASVRVIVVGALVVAGLTQLFWFAVAAATGSFAWLLFARGAARLVDHRLDRDEPAKPQVANMLMLLMGAGLTASVITGYPAMVSLLAPAGNDARLGVLFLTLFVARTPLMLLSPVQAIAVPTVVRLSATEDGKHRLRRLLAAGSVGALALAALGALVGYLIGPWAVGLVYGADKNPEAWWVAGLVWSSVLIGAIQLLAAVLVARAKAGKVLVTWAAVVISTALVLLLLPGDTVFRAVVGLSLGPAIGLVVVISFVLSSTGVEGNDEAS